MFDTLFHLIPPQFVHQLNVFTSKLVADFLILSRWFLTHFLFNILILNKNT